MGCCYIFRDEYKVYKGSFIRYFMKDYRDNFLKYFFYRRVGYFDESNEIAKDFIFRQKLIHGIINNKDVNEVIIQSAINKGRIVNNINKLKDAGFIYTKTVKINDVSKKNILTILSLDYHYSNVRLYECDGKTSYNKIYPIGRYAKTYLDNTYDTYQLDPDDVYSISEKVVCNEYETTTFTNGYIIDGTKYHVVNVDHTLEEELTITLKDDDDNELVLTIDYNPCFSSDCLGSWKDGFVYVYFSRTNSVGKTVYDIIDIPYEKFFKEEELNFLQFMFKSWHSKMDLDTDERKKALNILNIDKKVFTSLQNNSYVKISLVYNGLPTNLISLDNTFYNFFNLTFGFDSDVKRNQYGSHNLCGYNYYLDKIYALGYETDYFPTGGFLKNPYVRTEYYFKCLQYNGLSCVRSEEYYLSLRSTLSFRCNYNLHDRLVNDGNAVFKQPYYLTPITSDLKDEIKFYETANKNLSRVCSYKDYSVGLTYYTDKSEFGVLDPNVKATYYNPTPALINLDNKDMFLKSEYYKYEPEKYSDEDCDYGLDKYPSTIHVFKKKDDYYTFPVPVPLEYFKTLSIYEFDVAFYGSLIFWGYYYEKVKIPWWATDYMRLIGFVASVAIGFFLGGPVGAITAAVMYLGATEIIIDIVDEILKSLGIKGRLAKYIEIAVVVVISIMSGNYNTISDYIFAAAQSLLTTYTDVMNVILGDSLGKIQDKMQTTLKNTSEVESKLNKEKERLDRLYLYMPFEKLDLAVNATAMDPFDMLDMMTYSKTEVTFGGDEYGF